MKWSFMYCLLFIILIMKDSDSKAVKKVKTTKVPHKCQELPKIIKSCQKKSKKGTKSCKKLPSLKKDCKKISENKTGEKGTSVQILVIDIWRTHFLFSQAIIVSGGESIVWYQKDKKSSKRKSLAEKDMKTVEVLHSNGSFWCSLPDLPERRFYHTQTGLEAIDIT